MGSRYQEVFRLENSLYASDCPMIIEVGVLQKDNKENGVIAQIKVRNIGSKTVMAYKISLKAYEVSGEELQGIDSFAFMDMNIPYGVEGGSRTAIPLPDNSTRSFEAAITEIVFKDKTTWKSKSEWKPLPKARILKDVIYDDDLFKQYSKEVHGDCTYFPEKEDGIFQCSCGAVISGQEETCYKCKRSVSLLLDNLDADILMQKKTEQEYETLVSKCKKSDSANELMVLSEGFEKLIPYKESEKWGKDCIVKAEEINDNNYKSAKTKMDNAKRSEEYAEAENDFSQLGDYLDSKDLAEKCRELGEAKHAKEQEEKKQREKKAALSKKIKSIAIAIAVVALIALVFGYTQYSKYKNVETLCNNGKYEEALSTLQNEDIPFKDKLKYKVASLLYAEERYDEAKSIYSELGEYTDSAVKVTECDNKIAEVIAKEEAAEKERERQQIEEMYHNAIAKADDGDYDDAITDARIIGNEEYKRQIVDHIIELLSIDYDKISIVNSISIKYPREVCLKLIELADEEQKEMLIKMNDDKCLELAIQSARMSGFMLYSEDIINQDLYKSEIDIITRYNRVIESASTARLNALRGDLIDNRVSQIKKLGSVYMRFGESDVCIDSKNRYLYFEYEEFTRPSMFYGEDFKERGKLYIIKGGSESVIVGKTPDKGIYSIRQNGLIEKLNQPLMQDAETFFEDFEF